MGIPLSEVLEAPLDAEGLSRRWRQMLEDPLLANVPGKVELDLWGRIIMTPVNTEHGGLAGRLSYILQSQLGGRTLVEVGVRTDEGVFTPDVAWCSVAYWSARREQAPLEVAPELCIEIASPSNTIQDLRAKANAYIAAGASEAWIVFPRSRRVEFYRQSGVTDASSFSVDLSTLFD